MFSEKLHQNGYKPEEINEGFMDCLWQADTINKAIPNIVIPNSMIWMGLT